jgi:HEAT repeat protein
LEILVKNAKPCFNKSMVLFGPPDIGKLKSKRDIKGLTAALKHRDGGIRKNAAAALAELASAQPSELFSPAIALLIELLEDPTAGLLSTAILALSAMGQPAVLPLISALRAPGPRTREGAARALGRISQKPVESAYLRLAVDPLVALLKDRSDPVRLAAAWTMGRIGPQLEKTQRSLPTQNLILSLKDPTSEVREAAIAALGRMGDGVAIPPLIAALEDNSAAVRKTTSEALEVLGWHPISPVEVGLFHVARQDWQNSVAAGSAAVPALVRVLTGSDSSASIAAVDALGQIRSPEVVAPLIEALKNPDENIRAAAAAALEAAGAPEAIPALLKAIHDNNREVRKAIVRALGHTNDPRASAVIVNMVRTHQADMVAAVSDALVDLGSHAIPDLIKLLSEPDGLVQEVVPPILIRIGAPAVAPLVEMLRGAFPPINKLAAYILGEIRDARAVWPLVTALQNPDLTIPAAQALGKIGDSRAVKGLLDTLSSYSEATRQATTLALGAIGDPQGVEPLIQLLRSNQRETRTAAASALLDMYRSRKLDINQKRKILEYRDRITDQHTDSATHQDENKSGDWHSDHVMHEDRGIGLDFPSSMNH